MTYKTNNLKERLNIEDRSCNFSTIDGNTITGEESTFVFSSVNQPNRHFHVEKNIFFANNLFTKSQFDIESSERNPDLPVINFIDDDGDWDHSFAGSLDLLESMANKAQSNLLKGASEEVDWTEL